MTRHILIAGASRGIGQAIAQQFVDAGDTVSAFSRSGSAPIGVHAGAVDISDSQAVNEFIKAAIESHGPIDVLVVNAGIADDGLTMRMSDEQWHRVLHTNLDGAFYCTRAVLPGMIRSRRGSIIFIGSISPFMGVAGQANYAAAKAGLVGLARSLAKEVASRGITVNVVAPGLIDTDLVADLGAVRDAMESMIPLQRVGQPSDIAGVVGFLASNHASYITGAVLPVDGGMSMGF